ncbi:MAG: DUF2974 domain-containing protein [bacterium]|nr:DUF2974 domain-containing protein [bacterium]
MANFIDYLAWRGDVPFTGSPCNDVDNLIFCELAYLDLEGIVAPVGSDERITLAGVCGRYLELGIDQSCFDNDPKELLIAAAGSERFASVELASFANDVDKEQQHQFSAVTFYLPDGSAFVAFRGTDNTIVGWREDFNFSYLESTPGQRLAVEYLDGICASFDGPVRVGGHSKGGNFAVYAASFCSEASRSRVVAVYSNDGPGFNSSIADSKEYISILGKAKLFIPEFSIVGILLSNKMPRTVIKSDGNGKGQHNPYTWQVLGRTFESAERQAGSSVVVSETLDRWLDSLDTEQRQNLVDTIFDSLEASGADTLSEIKENPLESYNAVLRAVISRDEESRGGFMETLKLLVSAGKDVMLEETKSNLLELFDIAARAQIQSLPQFQIKQFPPLN